MAEKIDEEAVFKAVVCHFVDKAKIQDACLCKYTY